MTPQPPPSEPDARERTGRDPGGEAPGRPLAHGDIHEAVARERRRVAREIHDLVGHRIALLKLQLRSIAVSDVDPGTRQVIVDIASQIDQISDLMYDALYTTRVAGSELVDPRAIIEGVVACWNARCPLKLVLEPSNDLPRVPRYIATVLADCLNETVINIIKHALTPTKAQLTLQCNRDCLELSIIDNGEGIIDVSSLAFAGEPNGSTRHFGLLGMRERLAEVEGWLIVEPALPSGLSIVVSVPVRSAQDVHPGSRPSCTCR